MQKLVTLSIVVLTLAATLAACTTTSGGATRSKCPACGYEFDPQVK